MNQYKHFLSAALALGMVSIPFVRAVAISEDHSGLTMSRPVVSPDVRAFAIGPGLTNLSLGDSYATYQWGLKNDGEFQLTTLQEKFREINTPYGETGDRSGEVGIPKIVGPGAYEAKVTHAVSGIDIRILPAWDLYNQAQTKRDVIVAVIDTGIDYTHPELQNCIWTNKGEIPDGIDNDNNGYIDDIYGWNFYYNNNMVYTGIEDSHGTHAAGTIAANKGAGGIAGITDNQHVKLMSLKALGGYNGSGSTSDVIAAIRYAEANGASICNLSFGTSVYDEQLAKVMAESKMLFVVASGNGDAYGMGYSIDQTPVYPAAFSSDNIISVANLLFDGSLSRSSNYGAATVDIAAPGSYVLSCVPGKQYGFMTGTSMAAPMVTGVAAMLYSYRTDISLADVKTILLNSARKLEGLDGKLVSGGMLDAEAALSYH